VEGSSLDEIQLASPKKVSRRSFLRRAGLSAGLTAVGLVGYSGLIEPNEVEVKKIEVRLQRLSPAFDRFKIGLISDFHFGPFTGAGEISAAVRSK
jgi:predicted MPP superfamily phosphohydrolase